MFAFAAPRPRRRPSLTPMIDVVFLLLIFFMLSARFGIDQGIAIGSGANVSATYSGPPRLVDVAAQGVRLNGVDIVEDELAAALRGLMQSEGDTVVVRPLPGAALDVQQVARLAVDPRHAAREVVFGVALEPAPGGE